jgi:hypothetical protein
MAERWVGPQPRADGPHRGRRAISGSQHAGDVDHVVGQLGTEPSHEGASGRIGVHVAGHGASCACARSAGTRARDRCPHRPCQERTQPVRVGVGGSGPLDHLVGGQARPWLGTSDQTSTRLRQTTLVREHAELEPIHRTDEVRVARAAGEVHVGHRPKVVPPVVVEDDVGLLAAGQLALQAAVLLPGHITGHPEVLDDDRPPGLDRTASRARRRWCARHGGGPRTQPTRRTSTPRADRQRTARTATSPSARRSR